MSTHFDDLRKWLDRQMKKLDKKFNKSTELEIDENSCLHCGSGEPRYCEDCYQNLIATNTSLQLELSERYDQIEKLVDENNDMDLHIDTLEREIRELKEKLEMKNMVITDLAEDSFKYYEQLEIEGEEEIYIPCTSKEWDHCEVEKRGCIGCHYDIERRKVKDEIL